MNQDIKQETEDQKRLPVKKRLLSILRIFLSVLKCLVIVFFIYSILAVLLFAFIPPPATPLMVIRAIEQKSENKDILIDKKWMPIEKISPNLVNAVVASEDNRFLSHWGIDRQAIEKAIESNRTSSRKRGASTITQQVAKNLFLWPSKTYIRKGFELYFTFIIELCWSKRRIMEVYLNIIETGDGIYGAEAAAQEYFHKSAIRLSREEAALLAISLPNPRERNPSFPNAYMISRQNSILDLMVKIGNVNFD